MKIMRKNCNLKQKRVSKNKKKIKQKKNTNEQHLQLTYFHETMWLYHRDLDLPREITKKKKMKRLYFVILSRAKLAPMGD